MSSDSQIFIPDSFVALYVTAPGRRLREPREVLVQRYELCEDMAAMLSETARTKVMDLGVDEAQVLERILQGLQQSDVLQSGEALWVTRRLAELLAWPLPPQLEWRAEED